MNQNLTPDYWILPDTRKIIQTQGLESRPNMRRRGAIGPYGSYEDAAKRMDEPWVKERGRTPFDRLHEKFQHLSDEYIKARDDRQALTANLRHIRTVYANLLNDDPERRLIHCDELWEAVMDYVIEEK